VTRISIALPVRDGDPWLGECLASVLAQTEPDFELLAVDDGSRDDSRRMLDEAASRDARIRVLETSEDSRGIVHALNLALSQCRSPLVARMDADDRMLPTRLARQAAALDGDDSIFAVTSLARAFPDEDVTDGMRAYVDWQNGLRTPEQIHAERFVESPLLHPSVMMRTDTVRGVLGGWRDMGWPEDWDFFLRAFGEGLRVARVSEVLVEWRQHAGQLTRRDVRYSSDALLELRATFLAAHLQPIAATDRAIFVLGAGPVGKALVKALARQGIVANGIVDVDPRKIGGVVRGAGHRWRVVAHTSLEAMRPRPYAVSAVSGVVARARVREELTRWGWNEAEDFVVAA